MLTCAFILCMWQVPSAFVDRTDFTFVDMSTGEMLKVEWISPDITKNMKGDECWLFDGEHVTTCDPESAKS